MRTKLQQYVDIAAILAESTITNQNNDTVYAEAERGLFMWLEASTETADDVNILKETRTSGAGRWHRIIAASGIFKGTATSGAIPNGNSITVDVTVTGASSSKFNSVRVSNAATLNTAGLDLVSSAVVSANTVRVTLYNNTGNDLSGQTVDVEVLQY